MSPSLRSCPQGSGPVDRVAIVTGASRGLGAAFARALSARGFSVALFARSEAPLEALAAELRAAGGRAIAVSGDGTDPEAVRRLVARTEAELGPVDLLVANAGVWGPIGPTWELDAGAWWRAIEVNLKGPMLATGAALPGMVARGAGRVILLSSHAGVHRWPTCSSYSVGKGAVIKLAENLGAELKGTGVSIFAYHPGLTTIGLTEEAHALQVDPDSAAGRAAAWVRDQVARGHAVDPARSVAAVVALAEGAADDRSGTYLTVDDLAPAARIAA